MDYLNQACHHTKDLLLSMTPAARIVIGLLLAVVVISLAFLFQGNLGQRQEYLLGARVFSTEELTDIEAAFSRAGLNEYELDGKCIKVPRDRKAAYIGAMADANALPPDFNEIMDEALNGSSPWDSREKQQARLKNAKQKELALILRAMKDIDRATVQYDIEQGSGFPRTKVATAMVAVRPAPGTELDPQRVRSIRDLVAATIADLKPENVTVTDLGGRETYTAESLDHFDGGDHDYLATKQSYEKIWSAKVRDALAYIPDIVVAANVELGAEPHATRPGLNASPSPPQRYPVESPPIVPGGAVLPGFGQVEAVATGSEAGSSGDRQPGAARPTSLLPAAITVTVGIPSRYYIDVWRHRNAAADRSQVTTPAAPDLEQIEAEVKTNVGEIVSSLLAVRTGESRPDRQVKVTTYQSLPTVDEPPATVSARALTWLADQWATLGMILVGVAGFVMVRRMVRTAPAATETESIAGSSAPQPGRRKADLPESRGEAARQHVAPALVDDAAETKLKMDLADMVRENPDAAATILNHWIADAA